MSLNELRGNVFKPEVIRGKDGKSAYEIAKENGFNGTEQEWLESLKGTTRVVPVVMIDDAVYLNSINDLGIQSVLELYDDNTGGIEERILSRVTESNSNACIYNGQFEIETWYHLFIRGATHLRFFSPSGIFGVVHFFAKGIDYLAEFGDNQDIDIELTNDVEFILIEII